MLGIDKCVNEESLARSHTNLVKNSKLKREGGREGEGVIFLLTNPKATTDPQQTDMHWQRALIMGAVDLGFLKSLHSIKQKTSRFFK
jgi:hypothetical protein